MIGHSPSPEELSKQIRLLGETMKRGTENILRLIDVDVVPTYKNISTQLTDLDTKVVRLITRMDNLINLGYILALLCMVAIVIVVTIVNK